ncbi:peptidoglycan-binding protein [Aneurinibacillus thermoaerophilus]
MGQNVSHGCFRMRNRDIEELYEKVPVGTIVIVEGPITGHKDLTYHVLVRGSRGTLVQLVQNHLRAAGFYHGTCHGIFDRSTEQAVTQFQKQSNLPVTKQIHETDLLYLGIIE